MADLNDFKIRRKAFDMFDSINPFSTKDEDEEKKRAREERWVKERSDKKLTEFRTNKKAEEFSAKQYSQVDNPQMIKGFASDYQDVKKRYGEGAAKELEEGAVAEFGTYGNHSSAWNKSKKDIESKYKKKNWAENLAEGAFTAIDEEVDKYKKLKKEQGAVGGTVTELKGLQEALVKGGLRGAFWAGTTSGEVMSKGIAQAARGLDGKGESAISKYFQGIDDDFDTWQEMVLSPEKFNPNMPVKNALSRDEDIAFAGVAETVGETMIPYAKAEALTIRAMGATAKKFPLVSRLFAAATSSVGVSALKAGGANATTEEAKEMMLMDVLMAPAAMIGVRGAARGATAAAEGAEALSTAARGEIIEAAEKTLSSGRKIKNDFIDEALAEQGVYTNRYAARKMGGGGDDFLREGQEKTLDDLVDARIKMAESGDDAGVQRLNREIAEMQSAKKGKIDDDVLESAEMERRADDFAMEEDGIVPPKPEPEIKPEPTAKPVSGEPPVTKPEKRYLPEVEKAPEPEFHPPARDITIQKPGDSYAAQQLNKLQKKELFTKFQEKFENSFVRVKNLMEEKGMKWDDASNPVLAENNYHGRAGARMEVLEDSVRGIQTDIQKSAKNLKMDADGMRKNIDDFLHARDAVERNKRLGEGAAGITTEEAETILKNTTNPEIKRIAEDIQKMDDEVLDILLDGQLIDQKQYDAIRASQDYHVPLNRVMEDADNSGFVNDFIGVSGRGVESSGLKGAKGSKREVESIFENITTNYKQAIERAEKNRVNLATLNFVRKNNYLDGAFEVVKGKPVGTRFDGSVMVEQPKGKNIVPIMEDGKTVYLNVKDEKVAAALNGTNMEHLPAWLSFVGHYSNFLSSMATRFSLPFQATNKIRDLWDVSVNMSSILGKGGGAKALANERGSMKGVIDSMRGKDTEWARLYKQMQADGGTTGGLAASTKTKAKADFQQIIKEVKGGKAGAQYKFVKAIDNWGSIFEDSTRLSAYKAALDSGLSREQAAYASKNSTVNFNKKGTHAPIFNAFYMFSKASIAGSARTIKSLRNPRVAAQTTAVIGTGVWAANRMNEAIDPDWKEKVAPYDLQSGFVIVLPSGSELGKEAEGGDFNYLTIPISWGLKPIKIAADAAYDIKNGEGESFAKNAEKLIGSVVDSYNPAGGTDWAQMIMPTIADMPMSIYSNKAWHGGMIKPTWKEGLPGKEQMFDSTAEGKTLKDRAAVKAADLLSKVEVDASPESIKYFFDQMVGGAGREVGRLATTAEAVVKGETKDLDPKDVPFLSRFLKTKTSEKQEKAIKRKHEDLIRDEMKSTDDIEKRKDIMRDEIAMMNTDDAKHLINRFRLDGYDIKGVKTSENPRKPKAKVDKVAGTVTMPTESDWYGYFRSKKFGFSKEEAKSMSERAVGTKKKTKEDDEYAGMSQKERHDYSMRRLETFRRLAEFRDKKKRNQ